MASQGVGTNVYKGPGDQQQFATLTQSRMGGCGLSWTSSFLVFVEQDADSQA